MRICALDLSLTRSGWATSYDVDCGGDGACRSGHIDPGSRRGTDRMRHIREVVLNIADAADLVVIEGLAFGARGSAMLDLAGLGWVVRVALAYADLPFVDVPPACLKLFATGKGNAKKDEVFAAAIRKLSYGGSDHNEADALWLLQMASDRYLADSESTGLNEYERRALSKIVWPEFAT